MNNKENNNFTTDEQKALLLKVVASKIRAAKRSPLSFSQERIWSITQLNPDNTSFNLSNSFYIIGELNESVLEKSLNEVVRRHEILRSVFFVENQKPVQVALPIFSFKLKTIDQSAIGPDKTGLEQIISRERKQSFDLQKGLPFRAVLIKLAAQKYILILIIHQIIIDAESWPIIIQDLGNIYQSLKQGLKPSLPNLPMQYADYASWQRQRLTGESYLLLNDYWRERFKESIAPLQLPADRVLITRATKAYTYKFNIESEIVAQLKLLSQKEKVSLFVTLLTTLNCLLYMYTKQEHFLIFSSVSSKNRPELKALIGLFSNLVPLQIKIMEKLSLKQIIESTHKEVNDAVAHQDLPFDKITEYIKMKIPGERISFTSLFQVMFTFRYEDEFDYDLGEIRLEPFESVLEKEVDFQIRLGMIERQGHIACALAYNASIFEESTIKQIVAHYLIFLETFSNAINRPISEAPVLQSIMRHSEQLAQNRAGSQDTQIIKYTPPTTDEEKRLAEIWQEVLNIDKIGVNDNFFNLGGDSLLALRMIDKAKEENILLNPSLITNFPTISELIKNQAKSVVKIENDITGEIPLTCDQYWYLKIMETEGRHQPNRFNINMLFETAAPLEPQYLEKAVRTLIEYHDGLRARFIKKDSSWRQFIVQPDNEQFFYLYDLSSLSETEQKSAIEKTANDLQNKFDLQKGPLFLVALFHLGKDKPQRLFLTSHHLVADNQSIEILFRDFQKVYRSLVNGRNIQLPPKVTSLKQYAIGLNEYAKSSSLTKEIDYWLNLPWDKVPYLPVDYPDGRENNLVESERDLILSLSTEETNALLGNVKTYQTQLVNVLLLTLADVLTEWSNSIWTEINVVNSGRNIIPELAFDLSHTVGWFAMSGVLVLQKIDDASTAEEMIRQFERNLAVIPNQGYGFCLLTNLHRDEQLAEKLLSYRKEEILFNFMGKRENEQSIFKTAKESTGLRDNPKDRRFTLINCISAIANSQLTIRWSYSRNVHKRTTIEGLANRYMELLKNRFI